MNHILLAQTDTTVGFLSQDAKRLEKIKMRPNDKPFLKVYAELQHLKNAIRIPSSHRHRVRYSKKTTFVVKNQAFRLVQEGQHSNLIHPYGWLYSTSANESGKNYNSEFCKSVCDWIIEDERGLHEAPSSKIYQLTQTRVKRLR